MQEKPEVTQGKKKKKSEGAGTSARSAPPTALKRREPAGVVGADLMFLRQLARSFA